MNINDIRYEEAKKRRLAQLEKGVAPQAKSLHEMIVKLGIRLTDGDGPSMATRALAIIMKRNPEADRAERVAAKKERKQVLKSTHKKPAKGDVKASKSRARKVQIAVA